MSLKKVTSINTSAIKQIVLKDVIVDENNCLIELENIFDKVTNEDIYYIDLNGKSKNIYFEKNDLPYCCGLYEIGDLNDISFVSQKAFNILIKGLLITKFTFIINTNGDKYSKTWDEKLIKSKMFTCVKEFVNPNSSNIIKIWISNHIK